MREERELFVEWEGRQLITHNPLLMNDNELMKGPLTIQKQLISSLTTWILYQNQNLFNLIPSIIIYISISIYFNQLLLKK